MTTQNIQEWSFSSSFPLPCRVLIITTAGLWAWGTNLQILSWASIDAHAILTGDKKKYPYYKPIYKCFQRVVFSGLDTEVYLCDKILADIMTSYAKVFGDLYKTMCILFIYGAIQEDIGNKYYVYVFAPLITCFPYFIRFKQCFAEYLYPKDLKKAKREHLFNALKYCSAFPVIFFSALHKRYKFEIDEADSSAKWIKLIIFDLWIISVAINSIYSFYWDVAKDWKLAIFTPASPHYLLVPSFKLRSNLTFEKSLYYIAIFLNFLLRFTWSLKLSSHLHIINLEPSVFLMECLEVTRRWLWIFFRLESEWIETDKTTYIPLGNPV
ncbi:15981_t:CDS:2 [Cetraspora pellucida]|uniref:15981_t:CDS:1 n=1 Tax=Cetraspora pellucida TaxID=1433469 RepID=A0ACA9KST1_9GLOM|nr:15981_t:CDS:2 [Cetraspora pellucida]